MSSALILSAIFATACSETIVYRCPPISAYSKEFQAGAAGELEALPNGSRVGTLVTDYGKMRKACRSMEAIKH